MDRPIARGRLLVVCAVLAGLLLGLGLTVYAIQSGRNDADAARRAEVAAQTDARICRAVNRLNNVIVALLERSQRALPSNPFYKEHPELLDDARKQNARALREFRRATCLPKGAP